MNHEKTQDELKKMTEHFMQSGDMNYGEARLQALKFAWEAYLPEGEKSEDKELLKWLYKTWKTLQKAGLAPGEPDLPAWFQAKIRAGREKSQEETERAAFKRTPEGKAEAAKEGERKRREKWEKLRSDFMREKFGEPENSVEKWLMDIAQSLRDLSYFAIYKAPQRPEKTWNK